MQYDYRCEKCNEISEIRISTSDIVDKLGRVDQEELTKRIREYRECQCGGELRKIISNIQDPLWFNVGAGWGKISQRIK